MFNINEKNHENKVYSLRYLPWVIGFSIFIEMLDASIINIAIPQISIAFGQPPVMLKIAITSYILGLAIFIPISGWVADRYGMATTFSNAILVFIIGSLLCALSSNAICLALARFVQGTGGAMMMPVGRLILLRSFSKVEFVKVISYVSISSVMGFTLGPIVGGLIITYASWKWIFYLNIPFGLLGIYFSRRMIENIKLELIKKFDSIGFFLFALGLTSLSIGVEIIGDTASISLISITLIVFSMCLFLLYVYHTNKIKIKPIIDLSIFKTQTFKIGLLGNLISRISFGGGPYLLSLMFQLALGLNVIKTSILILIMGSGLLVMKVISKKTISMFGFKQVLIMNALLSSIFTAAISLIDANLSHYLIAFILFFYGATTSLQLTTMNIINYVDILDEQTSSATSMTGVIQQAAWGIGVATAAFFLVYFSTFYHLTGAHLIEAFHYTFIVLSIICLASVPVFMRLNAGDGEHVSGYVSYK